MPSRLERVLRSILSCALIIPLSVIASIACPAQGLVHGVSAPDDLLVASSSEHVWVVTRDPNMPGSWRLIHHGTAMDGPFARVARTLDARPRAIAARGDQVLLALPPRLPSDATDDILGVQVRVNPALDTYYDLPLDGWNVFAGIPSEPRLGGLAVGATGPIALLLPTMAESRGVRRTRTDTSIEDSTPELLVQSAFAWTQLPLPEDVSRAQELRLLPVLDETDVSILTARKDGRAGLFTLADGAWSMQPLEMLLKRVLRVVRHQGRYVYCLQGEAGSIRLVLERGGNLLTLLETEQPEGAWGIASIGDALLVISVDEQSQLTVSTLDALRGELGPPAVWERPPLDVSEWLHLPIVGMLVIAALLAIILFRPTEAPDFPILCGVVPLGLPRRLLALLIDLAPGVVVAMVFFEIDPAELSLRHLLSSDMAFAGPGSIVIGITIAHELCLELVCDRSFGKLICGGIVRSSDGNRPGRTAILLRNLFKAVVLYAPILVIFVLLSPARQGIPETVSRTVVADTRRGPAEPETT